MTNEKNTKVLPHIRLTKKWIEKSLPFLNERELKVYLKLAVHYNVKSKKSFPGGQEISRSIGSEDKKIAYRAIKKLEEKGLIEVIKRGSKAGWPHNEYRLLHVDEDGYHRAERCQFTLKEALRDYRERISYTTSMPSQKYETEEDFLKAIGRKYPDFPKDWRRIKDSYPTSPKNPIEDILYDLIGYLVISHKHKYQDIWENYPHKFHQIMPEWFRTMRDKEEAIKKDLKTNEKRAEEDITYCTHFLDRHPEIRKMMKSNPRSKWKRLLSEKYPEAVDIMDFNYGVLRELADKHGTEPRQVYRIFTELTLSKGFVGVIFDIDGYVSDLELPTTTGLSEQEERLLNLPLENEYVKDPITGKKELIERGFTPQERRNYKETLERIKAAKEKYVDYIINRATEELADLCFKGYVRKDVGKGEKAEVREKGVKPEKLDLEGLLQRITYKINKYTASYRGEGFGDSLVKIPSVDVMKVKKMFEEHLKELKKKKKS